MAGITLKQWEYIDAQAQKQKLSVEDYLNEFVKETIAEAAGK